jgi:hypothetical protein
VAPIEGVEQETEDGVAVYEGHWHKDGKLVEATVKSERLDHRHGGDRRDRRLGHDRGRGA